MKKANRSVMSGPPKTVDAHIGMAKMLRVYQLIIELKKNPMTIEQMAHFLSTSKRSAYRYIDLINEVGFETDKDFYRKFFIVPCKCPFCGSEHNEIKLRQTA